MALPPTTSFLSGILLPLWQSPLPANIDLIRSDQLFHLPVPSFTIAFAPSSLIPISPARRWKVSYSTADDQGVILDGSLEFRAAKNWIALLNTKNISLLVSSSKMRRFLSLDLR
jgi:hypothetical protein